MNGLPHCVVVHRQCCVCVGGVFGAVVSADVRGRHRVQSFVLNFVDIRTLHKHTHSNRAALMTCTTYTQRRVQHSAAQRHPLDLCCLITTYLARSLSMSLHVPDSKRAPATCAHNITHRQTEEINSMDSPIVTCTLHTRSLRAGRTPYSSESCRLHA